MVAKNSPQGLTGQGDFIWTNGGMTAEETIDTKNHIPLTFRQDKETTNREISEGEKLEGMTTTVRDLQL